MNNKFTGQELAGWLAGWQLQCVFLITEENHGVGGGRILL